MPADQPGILSIYVSLYWRRADGRKIARAGKVTVCSACLSEAHNDLQRPVAIGSGKKLGRAIVDRLQRHYNQILDGQAA
jgi:hypothetical protein